MVNLCAANTQRRQRNLIQLPVRQSPCFIFSTVGCYSLDDAEHVVGRDLQFDPQVERFIDDEEANALLTRGYREPFVAPEVV